MADDVTVPGRSGGPIVTPSHHRTVWKPKAGWYRITRWGGGGEVIAVTVQVMGGCAKG